MRNFSQIIDRLLERFQNREIDFDDHVACYFMANLRQMLEASNQMTNYPTLNLYTNWCLHPKLDRNNISQQVLSSIISVLPTANEQDPTFIDMVNKNLRGEDLQNEIIRLSNNNFRNIFNDNALWRKMFGVILNLVTNKPLAPLQNIPANSTLRIMAGATPTINHNSTIRLWLHGERGQQAEWTIAVVPDGTTFDINDLSNVQVFNGGVFTR